MGTIPLHDARDPNLVALVASDLADVGVSAATNALTDDDVAAYASMVDSAVSSDAELLPSDRREAEFGRVVFLPHHDPGFLDVLDIDVIAGPCDDILGRDSTLYTMTSACQPPGGQGRTIHVDTSIAVPGYTIGLGVLILLDDFTPSSGPTRFFPDETIDPPDPQDFEDRSLELIAPRGTVCWFKARQWHDALPNTTNHWRRCLILAFVRPWIRQRFDMARMVSGDPASFSPRVRQKLGFDLMPPGSYEEFYLPASERRERLLTRARSA